MTEKEMAAELARLICDQKDTLNTFTMMLAKWQLRDPQGYEVNWHKDLELLKESDTDLQMIFAERQQRLSNMLASEEFSRSQIQALWEIYCLSGQYLP